MTTQLSLYNKALLLLGEEGLSALTDSVAKRRDLDTAWNDGATDACLSQGQWKFAMRTVQIDYDSSITPNFGYQYAFSKPADFILVSALCSDDHFSSPVTAYDDDPGYWYADLTPIYVRYVSNDASYGGDMSLWSQLFTDYVAAYLASQVVLKIAPQKASLFINPQNPLHTVPGRALLAAKSRDAMGGPEHGRAPGNWTRSRLQGGSSYDGGSISKLTG